MNENELDYLPEDEGSHEPEIDPIYDPYPVQQRDVAITLQEGRSMSVLALTWQRKVLPYLGTLFMHVCGFLFFFSLVFLIFSWLSPHDAADTRPNAVAGLGLICAALLMKLLLVAKLVTFWFTGPQAFFLCAAIVMLFLTAAKTFKLSFLRNGQTMARVDKNSIIVCKNWLNLFFLETTIKWYELALVSVKTKIVDGKRQELLSFATTEGKNIELDAGCLNDGRLRANLIALIKRYAPNALSSELEEKNYWLESSNYTDIWMDTLHQEHLRKGAVN